MTPYRRSTDTSQPAAQSTHSNASPMLSFKDIMIEMSVAKSRLASSAVLAGDVTPAVAPSAEQVTVGLQGSTHVTIAGMTAVRIIAQAKKSRLKWFWQKSEENNI